MIWELTFSEALLTFAIVLMPIYLVLLMLSEKSARQHAKSVGNTALVIVVASLFLLDATTIFLLNTSSFRDTPTYYVLILLNAGLLLCAVRLSPSSKKMRMLILLSAIAYDIALVYYPPSGLGMGERTTAGIEIMQKGYRSDDPTVAGAYNPFPLDVGLRCVFSMITSFPYISRLNNFIIGLCHVMALDLVLYALVRRITRSWSVGVFAVLISALTPTLIPTHEAKHPAMLLFLVAALALVKAFEGLSYVANIIVINVTYVVAIFFHPSAAIGGFLPLGIIAVGYVAKKALEKEVWERVLRSGLFRATAALLVTVTFARAIYTAGYLESILPAFNEFVMTAIGASSPSEPSLPVYEQSVSPLNAYAWATPVAMASALVIYSFLRRRSVGGAFPLAMYFVGAAFLLIGFLAATLRAGAFHGAMYPASVFLVPAAAILGWKVLRSRRVLAVATIVLFAAFAGVAVTDPALSRQRYKEALAGDIAPEIQDYSKSLFLTDVIPSGKSLIAPYEIVSCIDYLAIAENKPSHAYYTTSAKIIRDTLIKPLVDKKEARAGLMYVWPYRWFQDGKSCLGEMPVDVFFDDGNHVVFREQQARSPGQQ